MLTLLGLVLAFAFVAGDGWAQATTGNYLRSNTVDDYTFPYLSPDLDQKNILLNAFSFQMKLFGGIDGTAAGSIEALRYLAVLAMMIGGLMFVFNAKLRNSPITIATWLLVLIITAFAPYGSKLLFYPLSTQGLQFGYGGSEAVNTTCMPSERGASGGGDPLKCGFAPQLAAVHVAAVLQVLFSDLFNSADWVGLIESSNAMKNLESEKKLSSKEWLDNKKSIEERCGQRITWGHAMKSRAGENVRDQVVPAQMSDAWRELKSKYKDHVNLKGAFPTTVPNAIVLYHAETFPALWTNGLSTISASEIKINYAAGINELYDDVSPTNTKMVYFDSSDASSLSIKEALTDIKGTGEGSFFSAETECSGGFLGLGSTCTINPGFFFVWQESGGNESNVLNITSKAQEYRRCYNTEPMDVNDSGIAAGNYQNNSDYNEFCMVTERSYDPATQLEFFKNTINDSSSNAVGTHWANLLIGEDKLANPSSPLGKLPVGIATFKTPATPGALPIAEVNPGISCLALWDKAIDDVVNEILGSNIRRTSQLEPLKTLLLNPDRTVELVNNELPPLIDTSRPEYKCGPNDYDTLHNPLLCANDKIAESIETSFERVYRSLGGNLQTNQLTPEQNYEVLLQVTIAAIDASSERNRTPNTVEGQAADDSQSLRVVGNDTLTGVAGFAASMFGTVAVAIASWFTGPVAAAYVYFLSIMVNLALIALIVLTPILFLAGLAMPGAAIGLLTVSVVGVFVLKFVPVTLLILNNIGGMVYDMIGAGGGKASGVMQDLMIIAMAALYTNIVGMTFFLLFKLGDASAMLSRFTAIDSSAKQVADRGMALTIAATAAAGAALAAGASAVIGGSNMAAATRAAALKAGVPAEMLKMIQSGGRAKEDENPEGTDPTNPAGGDGGAGGAGAAGALGAANAVSPVEKSDGILMTKLPELEKKGILTKEQVTELAKGGAVVGTDGQWYESGKNADGSSYLEAYSKDGQVTSYLNKMSAPTAGGVDATTSLTTDAASTKQSAVVPETPAPVAKDGTAKVEGSVDTNTVPGAVATGTGGLPPSVRIAGGNLDSVGDVTMAKVQALGESTTTVQDLKNKKIMDAEATALAQQQMALSNYGKKVSENPDLNDDQKKEVGTILNSLPQATAEELDDSRKRLEAISLGAGGKNLKGQELDEFKRRNANDQIANELVELEKRPDFKAMMDKVKKGTPLTGEDEINLKKYYDGLRSFDTTAASMGEVMKVMSASQNLRASFDARKGADLLPSAGQNFVSGIYGSIAGSGGGLAKIPVLGPMVTESLNEYYQAPERAKAWNSVGGYSNWRELQGNAQRMGFYQKEMSPLAAGAQYDAMQTLGGFQAQVDIAQEAARQAVAKSRSQWEAMATARAPDLKMQLQSDILKENAGKGITLSESALSAELSKRFTAEIQKPEFKISMDAVELRGLGMMEAASRVTSVKREVDMINREVLPYQRVVGGMDKDGLLRKDENGQLMLKTVEASAVLTPELLSRLHSDAAVKSFAGQLDGMMVNAYGIFEKQYQRGDSAWNSTRDMYKSGAAAAQFVRSDISTDYLVGGHLKMVQGKEKFLESKEQYNTLLGYRNQSNQMIAQYVQQHMQSVANNIGEALKKADIDVAKYKLPVDQRAQLDKWAAKELIKDNQFLPLNLLFESAAVRGRSTYKLKAEKARSEMAAENEAVWKQVDSARRSALQSAMSGLSKSASKAANMDVNGFKAEAAAPLEAFTEWMDTALGTAAEQALTTLTKTVPENMQSKLFKSMKNNITNDKGRVIGREVVSMVDEKLFDEWVDKLEEHQKTAILAQEKYYRRRNGRIEMSYTRMNKDGGVEDAFNSESEK